MNNLTFKLTNFIESPEPDVIRLKEEGLQVDYGYQVSTDQWWLDFIDTQLIDTTREFYISFSEIEDRYDTLIKELLNLEY
jgi:hypothetical protein